MKIIHFFALKRYYSYLLKQWNFTVRDESWRKLTIFPFYDTLLYIKKILLFETFFKKSLCIFSQEREISFWRDCFLLSTNFLPTAILIYQSLHGYFWMRWYMLLSGNTIQILKAKENGKGRKQIDANDAIHFRWSSSSPKNLFCWSTSRPFFIFCCVSNGDSKQNVSQNPS